MQTQAIAQTLAHHFPGIEFKPQGGTVTVRHRTGIEFMLLLQEAGGFEVNIHESLTPEQVETIAKISKTAVMATLPVRRVSIECLEHPEWGTWGVMEDHGGHYDIHGAGGGRMLDKSEAITHWRVVPSAA